MIKAKNGLVLVKFINKHGKFKTGMIAGYSEANAADLVRKGIAGYAVKSDAPEAEVFIPTITEPVKPAGKIRPTNPEDAFGNPGSKPAPADPLAEIRAHENWRTINGNLLRSIASKVSDSPITNKDDAIAAIELALEGSSPEQEQNG